MIITITTKQRQIAFFIELSKRAATLPKCDDGLDDPGGETPECHTHALFTDVEKATPIQRES